MRNKIKLVNERVCRSIPEQNPLKDRKAEKVAGRTPVRQIADTRELRGLRHGRSLIRENTRHRGSNDKHVGWQSINGRTPVPAMVKRDWQDRRTSQEGHRNSVTHHMGKSPQGGISYGQTPEGRSTMRMVVQSRCT